MHQLCTALNINKRSVDRDLDVYRNLLSKLVQAKELLKEYVDRYEISRYPSSVILLFWLINYILVKNNYLPVTTESF